MDDRLRVKTEPISTTVSAQPGVATLSTWDGLVSDLPGSDVTQLSGWAGVRGSVGYRPLYVFAWRDGRLVGGAQVLMRRLPVIGTVGYVAYGPLVAAGAPRPAVVTALADALSRLARHRLRALFVQPADGGDDVSRALLARGFRCSTAGVAPATTVRIDLSVDEDELRAGMSRRIRRWTGKWERCGVAVRRGTARDVDLLIGLIGRTAAHQGFPELSGRYVRNLYHRLAGGGHAEIFVGEVDGEPVAAELFTACGGVLRSRFTGLDRSSPAVRLSVTSALDWEAIRWAKRAGLREFDVGGLSEDAASVVRAEGFSTSSLTGPELFKVAFGGRLHAYPRAVELISSTLLRAGYDALDSASAGRFLVDRARGWMRRGGLPRY